MVFRGVYPECRGSASGVVLECIRSGKVVKKDGRRDCSLR